jgi:iron complex outermembrane receptor protein
LVDLKPVILFYLKKIRAVLSAGANNLTNKRYAASILPNAVGFWTAQPHLLSGNPRIIMEDLPLVIFLGKELFS